MAEVRTWKEYQAMPASAMHTPANFLGGIWSPKKATPPASTMISFKVPDHVECQSGGSANHQERRPGNQQTQDLRRIQG